MTVYKRATSYNVYNVMLMLPKEVTDSMNKINKILNGLCNWHQNSKVAHISIKYLGYHKSYSKRDILKLLPEINNISKELLPLKLRMKGIKIHEVPNSDKLNVFILIEKTKGLQSLHDRIKTGLGSRIDHFTDWEGKHFYPHVTVVNASKSNIKEIKKRLRNLKIPKKPFVASRLALHAKKEIIRI